MLLIIALFVLLEDPPNSPEVTGPDPQALFAEARRRRRQRRLRVALIAFVVLAAGGGFYGAFGGGSPHLPTVPQIEAAVSARLARSHDLMLRETTTRPRAVTTLQMWTDLQNGNQRHDIYGRTGNLHSSFATTFSDDVRQPTVVAETITVVNYDGRTWQRMRFHDPATIRQEVVSRSGIPFVGSLDFRLLGRVTIDGQQAFHLRVDYPQPKFGPRFPAAIQAKLRFPTSMDVWISVSGSRLLREQTARNGVTLSTTDYAWLPRTAANLRHVELAVPAGYRHNVTPSVFRLPSKPPAEPTAPLQSGADQGVSVTLGANGAVVFDTSHASPVVRKTLGGHNTSYTCFRVTTNGDLTRVVSGERYGAFAGQVAFQLKTKAPFDGCELSTGYGQRWPAKFGGHDPVEIAFTPAGSRYFADRAAARELALFVRSRKVHEIRREPLASIAGALSSAYKHGVLRIAGPAPASSGEIGYAVTSTGVTFSDRSTTGRVFSVQVKDGRIARQNVKPLGYVF